MEILSCATGIKEHGRGCHITNDVTRDAICGEAKRFELGVHTRIMFYVFSVGEQGEQGFVSDMTRIDVTGLCVSWTGNEFGRRFLCWTKPSGKLETVRHSKSLWCTRCP